MSAPASSTVSALACVTIVAATLLAAGRVFVAAAPTGVASAPLPGAGIIRPPLAPGHPGPPDPTLLIDRLATLGARLATAQERGARAAIRAPGSRAPGSEADTILERALREIPDCGHQALHAMRALMTEDRSTAAMARRRACCHLVRIDLRHRLRAGRASGDRSSLDALVAAAIAEIAADEANALGLASVLIDAPYLRLVHEEAVLDLADTTTWSPGMTRLTAELVLTLWQNVARNGERDRADVRRLAIASVRAAVSARRTAAALYLCAHGEQGDGDLVLHTLRRRLDRDTCVAVAAGVARILEPLEALAFLAEVRPVVGARILPALLTLAGRDPAVLAEAYASSPGTRDASWRALVVTAAGFEGGPPGLELARVAARDDPSPDVVGRAILALAAHDAPGHVERVIRAALDRPAFARGTAGRTDLLLAVENLARRKVGDVVRRLRSQLER